MKIKNEGLFWAFITLVLFIAGYIFLRLAYHVADELPFSQEWVLIVLGTLVTITLTALLLNKQTEVELKKEERAKFLDLKTSIYFQLLIHIWMSWPSSPSAFVPISLTMPKNVKMKRKKAKPAVSSWPIGTVPCPPIQEARATGSQTSCCSGSLNHK